MSLFITSLNSGSNGNCYYVGNEREAVLVDAGISCRETETRMARLGLSMRKVKAIFISHEHTDHIRGITVLVNPFFADNPVQIGELLVTPFSKLHDAAHPHSFTVACDDIKVGVFTDIGA